MRAMVLFGGCSGDIFRLPLRDAADSICSESQQWGGFFMPSRNFENRTLYHGDNLPFLRGMNSGTVNLIATDPPFNKNRDFHADPGSLASGARFADRWRWEEDVHEEWVDQIKDDWPAVWAVIEAARVSYGNDMAAFLCWLGVRLLEMHRILADDGSIYLHIDHTAHAYVKALMDAIFGRRNFQNEIVWCYKSGGVSRRYFAKKHDTILFYAKGRKAHKFNVLKVKSYGQSGGGQGGAVQYFKDKNGTYSIVSARDWWEISMLSTTHPERTGYPTQKPLELYERIIRASSNEGDLVLDPFAGCATTPIAAERLGRQWVGMDIWDGAIEQVRQRLADNRQLLADPDPQVIYTTTPPERTDEGEIAAPTLRLPLQRAAEPWQRLSHRQMRHILEQAQAVDGLVGCAGCGRVMEPPFMELDHINPKSSRGENFITNRVLICRPCNGVKGNTLTLPGLYVENRKSGWMKDAALAQRMESMAQLKQTWSKTTGAARKCRPCWSEATGAQGASWCGCGRWAWRREGILP